MISYKSMPGFIYTVIIISAGLWWYLVHWVLTSRPDTTVNIATFFLILFFALGTTLSLLFYFYFYRISPTLVKLRGVYRRGAKWGFFASAGVVFVMAMKAFDVLHLINVVLFLVLYYAIYLQLRAKR